MIHRESLVPSPKAIMSGDAGPLPKRVKLASQMIFISPFLILTNAANMYFISDHERIGWIGSFLSAAFGCVVTIILLSMIVRKWRPASPLQIATFDDLLKGDPGKRRTTAARIETGMTFVQAQKEIDAIVERQLKNARTGSINRLRTPH